MIQAGKTVDWELKTNVTMGKTKGNIILSGLSGKVDRILLKKYSYGTVVSKMPDRSKVKLTAHQKKLNTRFQRAVQYAQEVIRDPKKKKQYEKLAKRKRRAVYHLAIADYLKRHAK